MEPKPYPFTPYLQVCVALAALMIGASAMFATLIVWRGEANARLVEIGVSVLRADPKKELSSLSARKWALDLIDANAGGVKFSADAREQLLYQALAGQWVHDFGPSTPFPIEPPVQKKNSN